MTEDALLTETFADVTDTRYLYFDASRRDVAAQLLYGLSVGKGLLLLTGEAGSGKTMMLSYLADAAAALHHVVHLCPERVFRCNPSTSLADMGRVCHLLPPLVDTTKIKEVVAVSFAERLDNLRTANRTGALLVDDCDLLADSVLDEMVTLLSLHAEREGELTILLAGRPEFRERLARVAPHAAMAAKPATHLELFAPAHVARLIEHRLSVGGFSKPGLFAPSAMSALADQSSGNPGKIVRLCAGALRIAKREQRIGITVDLIDRATDEDGLGDAAAPGPLPIASSASAAGTRQSNAGGMPSLPSDFCANAPLQPEPDLGCSPLPRPRAPASGAKAAVGGVNTGRKLFVRDLRRRLLPSNKRVRNKLSPSTVKLAAVSFGCAALGLIGTHSLFSADATDTAAVLPPSPVIGGLSGQEPSAGQLQDHRAMLGMGADQFADTYATFESAKIKFERSQAKDSDGNAAMPVIGSASLDETKTPSEVKPQSAGTEPPPRVLTISLQPADRDQPVYRGQEKVTLTVGTSEDAYIDCFYQDASGMVTRVFPTNRDTSALVPAGRRFRIPGEGSDFDIVLDQTASAEEVLCVGTPSEDASRLGQPFKLTNLRPLSVASLSDVLAYFQTVLPTGVAHASLPISVRSVTR